MDDGITTKNSFKSGKSNILEIWPNMEVYFHGGVNFIPYKINTKTIS